MTLARFPLQALLGLLPREFRERVVEPALVDLEHEERLSASPAYRQFLARTILIWECLRLGLPQVFWRRGRPTRVAISCLAVILFLVLLIERTRYVAAS